ncbi:MAG: type I secretion system permease/ATPase [Alphaproteobacteria bacterium]|nr:type I secretion system permease/ATPase [Alphaproteobacteria bacterium]
MAKPDSELKRALASCRSGFIVVGIFSFFINALMLTTPIFNMEVYNRILPTRSEPTLYVLAGLVVGLLTVMALLEAIRSRILVRLSTRLEILMSDRVLGAVFLANQRRPGAGSTQSLRDFDAVRQFLSGNAPLAFFDLPWTPLLLGVIFLLHPLLGIIATVSALVLFVLAVANELATRRPLEQANQSYAGFLSAVGGALRNSEVLGAMGMLANMRERWYDRRNEVLQLQTLASDRAGNISGLTKMLRFVAQTMLLGAGAWLAIHELISPGAIIASSIVMGRALAPFEMAIGVWKQFVQARDARRRLSALLIENPAPAERTVLPRPKGLLRLENVSVAAPDRKEPIVAQVNLQFQPGTIIGITGPSGSGKSSLLRTVMGVWPPAAGTVRLDGGEVHNWDPEDLGPHIGYLPQDVELFEGTVAENICRFGPHDSESIVAAARKAGAHEMILSLPKGYDTPVGPGGAMLSGGQRQRIGLARAIHGDPVIVALDEPNSNLDEAGDVALGQALRNLKQAGVTVLLVSHRPAVLSLADQIVVLANGAVRLSGNAADVLARLINRGPAGQQPQRPPVPMQNVVARLRGAGA